MDGGADRGFFVAETGDGRRLRKMLADIEKGIPCRRTLFIAH